MLQTPFFHSVVTMALRPKNHSNLLIGVFGGHGFLNEIGARNWEFIIREWQPPQEFLAEWLEDE